MVPIIKIIVQIFRFKVIFRSIFKIINYVINLAREIPIQIINKKNEVLKKVDKWSDSANYAVTDNTLIDLRPDLSDAELDSLIILQKLIDGLLLELECQICHQYFSTDIRQCNLGHSFCSQCLLKFGNKCPYCKSSFGNTRNFTLENINNAILIPCANWKLGCRKCVPLPKWRDHIDDCEFGDFHCPMRDERYCTWRERLSEFKKHLSMSHMIKINDINTVKDCVDNENNNYYFVSILSKDNKLFKMFEIHNINQKSHTVKWVTQYIGCKEQANDYIFTIEFQDQTNSGYTLIASCLCVPYEQLMFQKPSYFFSLNETHLEHYKIGPSNYKYNVQITHKSEKNK